MNSHISKTISFLRFPLVVGIVVLHSLFIISYPKANIVSFSIHTVLSQFTSLCVPAYFFISGYLFFANVDRFDKCIYLSKLKKRVKSLFVPFMLWNIVPVIIMSIAIILCIPFSDSTGKDLLAYYKGIDWLNLFWDDHYYNGGGTYNIFGWPVKYTFTSDGPMWYVRDLMFLNIISPVFYLIVKKMKIVGLLIIGVLYIYTIYPYFTITFRSVYYYLLGAFFGIMKYDITNYKIKKIVLYLFCVFLILSTTGIFSSFKVLPIRSLMGIFGVLSLFIISGYITDRFGDSKLFRVIDSFGKYAFFIFALHTIFVLKGIERYVYNITDSSSVTFIAVPVLTIAICILFYELLRKLCPKLLGVLVGGRI